MSLPTTDAGVHLKPAMNSAEIDLYSVLLSRNRSVVDFSDPGTTLLAVRHRVKQLISVQANPAFIATLRQIPQITEAEREERLVFVQPDIGRTNAKGKPVDKKRRDDWPLYYTQVWTQMHGLVPDIVFINGLFPTATALHALEHITPDTQLLVMGGTRHHRIEALSHFCTLTDSVQSLAVYRPKKHIDTDLLHEIQGAVRYNRRA
ncbi:MAG: hypothetical protein ACOC0D_07585 [Spirochaeta sp.]